jgi:hypothetical protein
MEAQTKRLKNKKIYSRKLKSIAREITNDFLAKTIS